MLDGTPARIGVTTPPRPGALRALTAKTFLLMAFGIMLTAHGMTAQAQIRAVITADNAYRFGYGTANYIPLDQLYGGVENQTAGDIFACGRGPETYTITPALTDYLYIVTWSDDARTQGVLGQFRDVSRFPGIGSAIYTGTSDWQVYATGIDFDIPSGGPSPAMINQQIALANTPGASGPASSGGWVGVSGGARGNLVVGAANAARPSTPSPFPYVCDISGAARWMWYNARPGVLNGFTDRLDGGGHREFLIFRIPARKLFNRISPDNLPGTGTGPGVTTTPGPTLARQCSLSGELSRVCELGRDSLGNLTYAFAVPLTLSDAESCELSAKMPPGAATVSYGPTTLSPGLTQVSGTFTVRPPFASPFCFELQCKSGEASSCSKTVCVRLPLRTLSANEQPTSDSTAHAGHHEASGFEVSGQFISLNTRRNLQTQPGVGGRVTYNVFRSMAVEAEANFFPRESFISEIDGGRVTQAFVGLKAGHRFKKFGLFATVKPGMQSFSRAVTGYRFGREFSFEPNIGRKTVFALNWGGAVELCPQGRVGARFDVGDTVTFHPGRTTVIRFRPARVPRAAEHNLQVSFGPTFRF